MKPVWPDEGPLTWAPRPTVTDITANDLRTRLYQFADDSMLGRRIGEPGNFKGTAYIAREFQRLGLKPGGDSGTYFQNLPFGRAGLDSATARLTANGRALRTRADWIPLAASPALGAGGGSHLTDVQTAFAGRWGDTATVLDRARFAGKIAVFTASPASVGFPASRPPTILRCDSVPDKFGAAAAASVEAAVRDSTARAGGAPPAGRGGVRDTRAQRAGAAGILFVVLDSIPRSTVAGVFASRMEMQADAQAMSAAAITQNVAAALFGGSLATVAVGTPGANVSESWSYDWHISSTPGRNVIAILPGSDPSRAAEYVLVGAHNDHIGVNPVGVDHDSLRAFNTVARRQAGNNDPLCRPTADQQHRIDSIIARARSIRPAFRDSIMNGADDDGSGTVLLLEIAERFAAEKPARSIIFVSHEGEEAGLLGSKWFTDHPTIPLTSIVAAHNMDMEGKGRVEQVKFGGPSSVQTLGARRISRDFGDIIDSVNAVRAEPMAIDKTWDVPANPMNRFCRSDQVNYVHHDIPTTYFSTGYAPDYHMVTDEPRYIDYDHMARVGRFVHDVMLAVADRRDRPRITGADLTYPVCR